MAFPLISILTGVVGVLATGVLFCALLVFRRASAMMPLLILGCGLRLITSFVPLLLAPSSAIGWQIPVLDLATHFWMLHVLSALSTIVFVLGLVLVLRDVLTQLDMLRGIVEDYEFSENV